MLKISYAARLSLCPAISAQFTFEMRVAARNRKKFTITTTFGGSRSFKVIDVNAKGNARQRCMFEGTLRTKSIPATMYLHTPDRPTFVETPFA